VTPDFHQDRHQDFHKEFPQKIFQLLIIRPSIAIAITDRPLQTTPSCINCAAKALDLSRVLHANGEKNNVVDILLIAKYRSKQSFFSSIQTPDKNHQERLEIH
jgi:hypothetical protein